MIDRDETLADLQATVDYVRALTEESDALPFELAAEVNDALGRVIAAAREAQSLMTTTMLNRLEDGGPRVFGNERFERVAKYVEDTNHEAVVKAVVNSAANHDEPYRAAYAAAKMMEALYLNKSTSAKKGEVDKLSMPRDAVFSKRYTGWTVERSEVADADA
jgi:hypothetical protein